MNVGTYIFILLYILSIDDLFNFNNLNGDNMQLIHGETLEEMSKIPDNSIDMILADLPYGTTQNSWDTVIPFDKLWIQYKRIIKDNGAILLFGHGIFANHLISSNEKMFRYKWIWKKYRSVGFLQSHKMPLRAFEEILVFYKHLPTYNPQMRKGKPYISKNKAKLNKNYGVTKGGKDTVNKGERYPIDVLEYAQPSVFGKNLHPTEKPTNLLQYLIKTYTDVGETVLDNTMGSGSTGVAAKLENRDFIGIELNDEYFSIALERINKIKD